MKFFFKSSPRFISISDVSRNPTAIFDEVGKSGKTVIVVRNNKPIGCITGINHFSLREASEDVDENL